MVISHNPHLGPVYEKTARRYDLGVKPRCTTHIASLGFWTILVSAQPAGLTNSSHVEITLPPSVASERLFVRYVLAGQELGGAVYGPSNVSSFVIGTVMDGHSATAMKAILYAPGCEIQTLSVDLTTGSDKTRYSFICEPLPDLDICGIVDRSDRLWQHKVKLQAKYIPRWAQSFLGLSDYPTTSIPVGDAKDLSADGSFHLLVPDFSQVPGRIGEFRIMAMDETAGTVVAMLVPPVSVRTRMGGLVVRKNYSGTLVFTPCSASTARAHNQEGFAIRPNISDSCDPF